MKIHHNISVSVGFRKAFDLPVIVIPFPLAWWAPLGGMLGLAGHSIAWALGRQFQSAFSKYPNAAALGSRRHNTTERYLGAAARGLRRHMQSPRVPETEPPFDTATPGSDLLASGMRDSPLPRANTTIFSHHSSRWAGGGLGEKGEEVRLNPPARTPPPAAVPRRGSAGASRARRGRGSRRRPSGAPGC